MQVYNRLRTFKTEWALTFYYPKLNQFIVYDQFGMRSKLLVKNIKLK